MSTSSADPTVNFSTFVISLASSALAHLGHVDESAALGIPKDRKLAWQSIALIDMLAEKTKGNLDAEEARLLEAIQRELHEKYAASER